MLVPNTIPVVEDKSLETLYQVMEVDPAADKGNPTTSSANYESSPSQILSSPLTVSRSAGERGRQPDWRHLVSIVVPVLARQVVVTRGLKVLIFH